MSYEKAWRTLLKSLDGKIDGTSLAAERGASGATRDLDILREIEKQIKKIAKENNIEKSVYDLDNQRGAIMETEDGKPIYILIGRCRYKDPGTLKPKTVDHLIEQLEEMKME